MAENKRELWQLQQMQGLPLNLKIRLTKDRIRAWVEEFGEDGCYISFSGGKDSTVLLDLVRQDYPNIPAVYVDTGLEYPEIKTFVKSFSNVEILKPKMTFKQVIEQYGYPLPSKEIATHVESSKQAIKKGKDLTKHNSYKKLTGNYLLPDGTKSHYCCDKWKFLLDADFKVSPRCCVIMKKNPSKEYEKKTGRHPFIGTMATESKQRETIWLKQGCNAFNVPRKVSTPMAFWTEQDIYQYIKDFNLPICSVYGEIVVDESKTCSGQMTLNLDGENQRPIYKTSGASRTGCLYCLFGAQLPENPRFLVLKEHHPEIYQWIMKPVVDGGLGYKEIIDYVNEHGKCKIKY